MKNSFLYLLCAVFVGACFMTSCEEGTGENTDDLATIYWNKSDAFRMQLKGKVKTMYDGDSIDAYTFNQDGNITQYSNNGWVVSSFTYTNGRLTRKIGYSHFYEEVYQDTTDYAYGTSGKYMPLDLEEVIEGGLFRNIASFTTKFGVNSFVTSGDSLLLIRSYGQELRGGYVFADTIGSLTFNGGLLPLTIRNEGGLTTFTYAEDGRFLTVQETMYDYSRQTTYKSNSNYMLPISRVILQQDYGVPTTTTYSYNDNEDLIAVECLNQGKEFSDYVYDSNGNWISRNFRYKYGEGVWSEKYPDTRSFTYWE